MKAPQIGRHGSSTLARKYAKRLAARLDRRAARRDPENAPTKRRYAGWSD